MVMKALRGEAKDIYEGLSAFTKDLFEKDKALHDSPEDESPEFSSYDPAANADELAARAFVEEDERVQKLEEDAQIIEKELGLVWNQSLGSELERTGQSESELESNPRSSNDADNSGGSTESSNEADAKTDFNYISDTSDNSDDSDLDDESSGSEDMDIADMNSDGDDSI